MDWHKRLTQAREAEGLKKSAFARLIGVSAPTVTDWENGDTKMIEGANLIKVCNLLKVTPDWLLHGSMGGRGENSGVLTTAKAVVATDEFTPGIHQIPMVKLRLQAGVTGFQTDPNDRELDAVGISSKWINRKGYDPAKLLAIQVDGESMEPTFYEGDTVIINLADRTPVDNGVFAVNYDGQSVVKRISRDAGQWWLMSDNTDQRKFYRRVCHGAECIIIGRIVRREGDHF